MGNKQSTSQNGGVSRSSSGIPNNTTNRSSNNSPQSASSNSISSPANHQNNNNNQNNTNNQASSSSNQNQNALPQNTNQSNNNSIRTTSRSRNANSESDQLAHQLLNLIMNRHPGSSSSLNQNTSSSSNNNNNSRSRSFRLGNGTNSNSNSSNNNNNNQTQNLNNSDQLNPFAILSNLLAADPSTNSNSHSTSSGYGSSGRRSHNLNFDEAMRQRLIYHNGRLFMNRGEPKKCEYCGKMVNPMREDPEIHMVKCMTKPRIKHTVFELEEPKMSRTELGEGDNDNNKDKNSNSNLIDEECTICFDEYKIGDKLARLECFCVFHKSCLDNWLSRKQCCPLHSHFEDDE